MQPSSLDRIRLLNKHLTHRIFLVGVLLGLVLVLLGWWLVPTASLLSVAGVGLILVIYGLLGYFGYPRLRSEVLRLVGVFGLLAGAIFAGEIVLEYVLLPKDNTSWGQVEFGSVFAVYFLTSLVVAYHCNGLRPAILAAVGNAMFSSVIWLIFTLLTFYIFRGSARQAQVFTAEGNYADFAHSGMPDFNTFMMEDFFGAGFYHLLLGPILAAVLGTLGGLLGKGLSRFHRIFPAILSLIALSGCAGFFTLTLPPQMGPHSASTQTYLAVDQMVPSQVIKAYLTQKIGATAYGGKVFSAYQIMGTEQADGVTKLYLWALVQEYYVDQHTLKDGTASSMPVVLFLKMQAGKYQIFDYKDAGEGYQYLTVNFPPRILPLIHLPAQAYNQRVALLSNETKSAAGAYFGVK